MKWVCSKDWQPMKPGQGNGRAENMPETWSQKSALAVAKKHQPFAVTSEKTVAGVFGDGASKLTRAEAAKMLQVRTSAHPTSCYRALRLKGRFARHLHSDGTKLSWR
jgi:hypothetical protein